MKGTLGRRPLVALSLLAGLGLGLGSGIPMTEPKLPELRFARTPRARKRPRRAAPRNRLPHYSEGRRPRRVKASNPGSHHHARYLKRERNRRRKQRDIDTAARTLKKIDLKQLGTVIKQINDAAQDLKFQDAFVKNISYPYTNV